jgi:hypothetical protein
VALAKDKSENNWAQHGSRVTNCQSITATT